MVARRLSHALFIFGSQGGLGKSSTILRTLDEEGVEPVLINSHVTPLALYATLFEYREDSVLFFDDVDAMYSSMPHLGLLRSALWGKPRIVTYVSSQLPSDLPLKFEFTSRCIFAANVIPKKNEAFSALLSRCDQFELSATNAEVIETMRRIAANGFQGVTDKECKMVIDFIEEHAKDRQLSLRLLGPSLRKLKYAEQERIDWKPLVESQLQLLGGKPIPSKQPKSKVRDLAILQEAIQKHPNSTADQKDFWCKQTNKSRASFFRALADFRKEAEV